MSGFLPRTKTVGFVLPETVNGPYAVVEYGEEGYPIRTRYRRLKEGERDPFSADEMSDPMLANFDPEVVFDSQVELFWERTESVDKVV